MILLAIEFKKNLSLKVNKIMKMRWTTMLTRGWMKCLMKRTKWTTVSTDWNILKWCLRLIHFVTLFHTTINLIIGTINYLLTKCKSLNFVLDYGNWLPIINSVRKMTKSIAS